MKRIIFILLLIVLAGCSQVFSETSTYSGGGVNLELVTYPRGDVFENEEINVVVKITNEMLNPLLGYICVDDNTPERMGGIRNVECLSVDLSEAEQGPSGKYLFESQNVRFGPYIYENLPEGELGGLDLTYSVSTDFRYDASYVAHVNDFCVKKSPNVKNPSGLNCNAKTSLNVIQPKLPLTIKNMKKEVVYRDPSIGDARVYISFTILKTEEGKVISSDEIYDDLFLGRGIVNMDVKHSGLNDFTCRSVDSSALKGKNIEWGRDMDKVDIECRSDVLIGQDYVSDILIVSLDYGFVKDLRTPKFTLKSRGLA